MNKQSIGLWLMLCYLLPIHGFGQGRSSEQDTEPYWVYRSFTHTLSSDTFCLDSIYFLQKGLAITSGVDVLLKEKDYWWSPESGCIIFDKQWIGQQVVVVGMVLNVRFMGRVYFRKSEDLISPDYVTKDPFSYSGKPADITSWGNADRDGSLNVTGTMSRAIGVGNTQDVILNADLNLQITGRLFEDMEVVAAITDQNNPIQPDGNTRQLQDFDRIFFSFIYKDSTRLTIGDYEMERTPGDYFKQLYKKSRGVQFIRTDSVMGGKYKSVAEMALSRGKFSRNEIQGQEGNQGPYPLRGAKGEVFMMIIAGTEKVYLDGKLLERGQQNDYVIDYNMGEVTFMPRLMINRYSRIVVEFQYADRDYFRTVLHGSQSFEKGIFRWRGGVYSEQDRRNQPFQQSLDITDSLSGQTAAEVMREAGDDPRRAVIPNIIRFSTFQTDRIMYRLVDTVGVSIYQFTDNPNSDSVFFQVNFSRVGKGNGNYVQQIGLANGRVYGWVAPVAGIPQGDFEPVVQLATPEKMQMITLGMDVTPDNQTQIRMELAASNRDINTFSNMDRDDNVGLAGLIDMTRGDTFRLFRHQGVLENRLQLEWVSRHFNYIERYRDVEFERSWNRQYANPSAERPSLEERILQLSGKAAFQGKADIKYKVSRYEKGAAFNGMQGGGGLGIRGERFRFFQEGSVVQSETRLTTPGTGAFFQVSNKAYDLRGGFTRSLGKGVEVGADYTVEQSLFGVDSSSEKGVNSFRYEQFGGTISRSIGSQLNAKLNAGRRIDYTPDGERMTRSFVADNMNVQLEKEGLKWKDRMILHLSYRRTENKDSTEQDAPNQVVLGRFEYQLGLFKRAIMTNTYFQLGTGREQRREFTYIEVPAGRGTHTWIDYNENGLQEINEFEIALFSDQAQFIKVMLPTNEFIRSTTNEFNQTLRITPPVRWQSEKGFRKILSRFSALSSYRADRRMTDQSFFKVINPFDTDIADTGLIQLSTLFKTTVFFNRSNPRFGMEYNRQYNANKQFLIQGFDSRDVVKDAMNMRFNMSPQWSLMHTSEWGRRAFLSDFSPNRNYDFDFIENKQEVLWQPLKSFRWGGFFTFYRAENNPDFGLELAVWREVGSEFRVFIRDGITVDGKFSVISIQYNGDAFSPVTYDMLRGFQNGLNANGSLMVGGRIRKNIQLTVNYEGRRSEFAPMVHLGRAEVRYLF